MGGFDREATLLPAFLLYLPLCPWLVNRAKALQTSLASIEKTPLSKRDVNHSRLDLSIKSATPPDIPIFEA